MAKRRKNQKKSPEISQAAQAQAWWMLPSINWKLFLSQATLIVATTLWVFSPAWHGNWIWDDAPLIRDNPLVHDPGGLSKIWFEPATSLVDYFPITVSAEWVQWQLWHDTTFYYHLVNVMLHILSALLVWRLLDKLGLRLAWLGGLLFAVHPIVVESVAWISELKNTLSLPPFLLAMCAFVDYDERGKKRDYFLALGLFLIALLGKTTMVMFPVVILLYLWWKRGRVGIKALKISAPFFAVSLVLGLTTVWFLNQHAIAHSGIVIGGFFSRLALAGLAMTFYFCKCLWPVGLMPIYPKWVIDPPSLIQFLPWPILGGVIYGLWTQRTNWGRHVLLGLGFFLINLLPFIGFLTGSYMEFTWVMDHLLYLPLIGLIGLAVAGLEQASGQLPVMARRLGMGIVAVIVALLAWGSHGYAKMFTDQETFWTYAAQQNPDAWLPQNNLGGDLFDRGHVDEGIAHYERAVKLKPDYVNAHYNLGNAFLQLKRSSEAIDQYEQALKSNPDFAPAHNNLGITLCGVDRVSEAIEQYKQAIKIDPNLAIAHGNLGEALAKLNRIPEAIEQYEIYLQLNPTDANTQDQLARLQSLQQNTPAAVPSVK